MWCRAQGTCGEARLRQGGAAIGQRRAAAAAPWHTRRARGRRALGPAAGWAGGSGGGKARWVAGLAGAAPAGISMVHLVAQRGRKKRKKGSALTSKMNEQERSGRGFLWQLTAAFIDGSAAACSAGRRCSGDPRRTEHVGERQKARLAAVASRCACTRRRDKTGSSEVMG
jgi:hypothetical protein